MLYTSPYRRPSGRSQTTWLLRLSFSDVLARSNGVLCLLGALTAGTCACAGGSPSAFLVPRLPPGATIDVLDNSLEEWPARTQAWVLDSSIPKQVTQVADIRGRAPADLSSGDARLRLLMAHDRQHWFLGFHVVDDRFVLSTQLEHPYGGDCFELFFAGEEIDSMAPINDILAGRDAASKPAFFQLNLQPTGTPPLQSAFSTHRTDPELIRAAIADRSFALSASKLSEREWIAELRLPLALMSDAVQARSGTETH